MLDCDLPLDSRLRSLQFRRRVLDAGDSVAVCAAFPLGAFLSVSGDFPLIFQADPVSALVALGAAVLAVLGLPYLTGVNSGASWFGRVQQVSLSLGAVFLLEALLGYIGFPVLLDVQETLLGSLICAGLLSAWYLCFRLMFRDFPPRPRVLLVGSDPVFAEMGGFLTHSSGEYQMLGPIPFPADIRAAANEFAPDEIVVGEGEAPGTFPANALLDLRFRGVSIFDAAAYFEEVLQRVSCRHLRPVRLLFGEIAPKRQNLAMQAIYSNLLGLAALALSSPVMILSAIALKISAPSVPLMEPYRAAGLYGVPFDRLRFQSRAGLGPWLEKMRLSGLPQLFNVVRGEMSLVGPRPNRIEYHDTLCQQVEYYAQRLAVRPGLTGWAQMKGGANSAVELEYDLYYIKNVSPNFDLDILISWLFGQKAG